jgi:MFS family permease
LNLLSFAFTLLNEKGPQMADGNTAVISRPEPTKFFRWMALIWLSLAMFGNYYIFDAINPLVDLFKTQRGFSNEIIGGLNSAYNIAAVIVLLIGGIMIDRLGTKISIIIFSTLCLIASIMMLIPGSAALMLASRFVLGMGAEPLIVAVTTALAKWFRGKELSFAFAVNLLIARFASTAADTSPSWAGSMFDGTWRKPLWLAVGAGVLCLVAAIVYWAQESYAERRLEVGQGGQVDKLVWRDIFSFGRSYWYIVAMCVTFYSIIFPFRLFAIDYFMAAHGLTREAAGKLNGLLPFMSMWSMPLFGLLADKIGKRALLMTFGSILVVPVFLMIGYTHIPLWLPVAMLGVAFSLIPAVMWPSVAYLVEERRLGSAYALMTLCQQVGWSAMNWAIGKSNDIAGASATNPDGFKGMLWMLSAFSLFALLFSYLLWREELSGRGHGLETIKASGK